MLRRLALAPLALLLACSSSSEPGICGSDGYHQVVDGANVCAYAQAIVIEGGFRCPASLPFRLDLDGAAICSDRMFSRDDLPDDLCRRVDRTCGRDGGRPDAGVGDDAGATCPSSIEIDTPCSSEGLTCGGPCTDACQFCNLAVCDGGVWTQLEAFPAPCFDCGDEGERCIQETEYCEVFTGGVAPGATTYTCQPTPTACEGSASCACIDAPGGDCDESGDGVVVRIFAP
ncbi:MAG: hypothetical protein H6721_11950 [Sandaracinus sp.]|nr:hypothetical protein [Myxococcales bacterium]MCB9615044.1 hypothetical protein [Sandaracinus sp.]MCB9632836.1 hypothetical protein [Sandaracinus sp.]